MRDSCRCLYDSRYLLGLRRYKAVELATINMLSNKHRNQEGYLEIQESVPSRVSRSR